MIILHVLPGYEAPALLISSLILQFFAILFTVACLMGTERYGFDRHIWDVPPFLYGRAALVRDPDMKCRTTMILNDMQMQWLTEGAFLVSTSLTKLSVLCFYRRLEVPCTIALKLTLQCCMGFTVCYTLGCLLTQILLCSPTSAYWSVPNPAKCTNENIYYPIQGSLATFSTLYTIMVPALALSNMSLSKFQRTGLNVITTLSLGVLGAGIARAVFLYRLVDSANGDATWNGFNVFVWSQLECQFALVCASIPFLQRFSTHYPTASITIYADGMEKNDSVISRVSSSLSGPIKRLSTARNSARRAEISRPRPQATTIPEWEFETLEPPRRQATASPVDEISYDRYVLGQFGPPAPPKDSRHMFDQYRRERHGQLV